MILSGKIGKINYNEDRLRGPSESLHDAQPLLITV
jgi:hypothetical protein